METSLAGLAVEGIVVVTKRNGENPVSLCDVDFLPFFTASCLPVSVGRRKRKERSGGRVWSLLVFRFSEAIQDPSGALMYEVWKVSNLVWDEMTETIPCGKQSATNGIWYVTRDWSALVTVHENLWNLPTLFNFYCKMNKKYKSVLKSVNTHGKE